MLYEQWFKPSLFKTTYTPSAYHRDKEALEEEMIITSI